LPKRDILARNLVQRNQYVVRRHGSRRGNACVDVFQKGKRQLRMDRITVPKLRELIDAGQELVILDVRPRQVRVQDGIIPGAIFAHPEDIDPIVKSYAPGTEIIVYCACPNEESAATAAKHLKQAGFKKIRPLLGGIEAWVKAGHPIEHAEPVKKAA